MRAKDNPRSISYVVSEGSPMRKSSSGVDMILQSIWFMVLVFALTACAREAQRALPYTGPPPVVYMLDGDVWFVHDPSIIKEGDIYYLFSSGRNTAHIPIRCSKDLRNWAICGDVFSARPDWALRDVPGVKNLWAPDISFFNGKYHLYYAISTFGSNHSAIGLATNQTLDPANPQYRWRDEGKIIHSRHYNDWNAIDPNIILDHDGQPWLAFGSGWSGIKLRRIDARTGRLSTDDTKMYSLAARLPAPEGRPVEAPFIIRRGAFYYLFVSFDRCCKGSKSTYKIMVGRSLKVMGPYTDRKGQSMTRGGGTLLIGSAGRWRGPGHNAVLQEEGEDKIIYHAYDAEHWGVEVLRIGSLVWDADGWPLAASPDAAP
jgi:arabinan endo-1,5-alpha-L-arabinosidase